MRPAGEIRAALRSAFAERGHATWREVLPACPVDVASPAEVMLVRRTVENMVQARELVNVGTSRQAGSRVARTLYELAAAQDGGQEARGTAPGPVHEGLDALQDVTRAWAEFV